MPSGVDKLGSVATQLLWAMCHTTPAGLNGSGFDAQLERDVGHVQVRKRQSTAEQQQRAAKQQRDKKVQRRDAESMQDDQDVSGDGCVQHQQQVDSL